MFFHTDYWHTFTAYKSIHAPTSDFKTLYAKGNSEEQVNLWKFVKFYYFMDILLLTLIYGLLCFLQAFIKNVALFFTSFYKVTHLSFSFHIAYYIA